MDRHLRHAETIAYLALAAIAATAAAVRGAAPVTLVAFVPATVLLIALLQGGTSVLLVQRAAQGYRARANQIVAAACALGALFAIVQLVGVPATPAGAPPIPGCERLAPWMRILQSVVFIAGAVAFAELRRRYRGGRSSATPQFLLATWLGSAAVFVAGLGAAIAAAVLVPSLTAESAGGELWTRAIRLTLLALVVAAFAHSRCTQQRAIGITTMRIALVTLGCGITLALLFDAQQTPTWYVGRLLYVLSSLVLFCDLATTLLRSGVLLRDAETALAAADARSQRNAARIRALWRVATSEALSDAEHLRAVLEAGAANLRPGRPMFASIAHLDGETIVYDATAASGDDPQLAAGREAIVPGRRYPVRESMLQALVARRRTASWNDLQHDAPGGSIFRISGWRSLIGTTLRIGPSMYGLVFASPCPSLEEPFAEDDEAFVDVLASQLSHRFSQREQLARLRHQMEHDSLTGLENRTEFRKALRSAVAQGEPFSLVLIDLGSFRTINETAGHLIGDELLVEVATTLAAVDARDRVFRRTSPSTARRPTSCCSAPTSRSTRRRCTVGWRSSTTIRWRRSGASRSCSASNCSTRSSAADSCSSTSRRSISRRAASSARKRWCAGNIPRADASRRASSCRSPNGRG